MVVSVPQPLICGPTKVKLQILLMVLLAFLRLLWLIDGMRIPIVWLLCLAISPMVLIGWYCVLMLWGLEYRWRVIVKLEPVSYSLMVWKVVICQLYFCYMFLCFRVGVLLLHYLNNKFFVFVISYLIGTSYACCLAALLINRRLRKELLLVMDVSLYFCKLFMNFCGPRRDLRGRGRKLPRVGIGEQGSTPRPRPAPVTSLIWTKAGIP